MVLYFLIIYWVACLFVIKEKYSTILCEYMSKKFVLWLPAKCDACAELFRTDCAPYFREEQFFLLNDMIFN